MTLEEYLNYDDGADTRYELVDGVLRDMGAESKLNAQIVMFLVAHLIKLGIPYYLLSNRTEVVVSSREVTTRYPDLVVLTEALEALMEDRYRFVIKPEIPPPQLVVEVVSPGQPGTENYDRDYVEKPQKYVERGIPEYWLIDPERAIVQVRILVEGRYKIHEFSDLDLIESPTFPELNLGANQILKAGR
jgi:Uma2 family endonuclease